MLLLKNCRYILTQSEDREILEKKDILIEDNRIIQIGSVEDNKNIEVIDCSEKIVMPGLINAHTHTITNILRGVSDDLKLRDWLEKSVWPAEARIDDVYYGSLLTCLESIKSGVTCFVDMGFQIERVLKAVRKAGMRAFLGIGMIDNDKREEANKKLRETEQFIKSYKQNELIKPTVAPHAPYTCSSYLLRESAKLAKKHDVLLQIHLLETESEIKEIRARFNKPVISYLDELGLLHDKLLAAHMCWLNEEEAVLLAKRKSAIVHCPTSNMKLATGSRLRLEVLNKLNIRSCLGTDSVASNNNLDMLEELKIAALLHKFALKDSTAAPLQQLIDMATSQPAEILGIKAGRIMPGFLADIVTIHLRNPRAIPFTKSNILSHIVYSLSGSDVSDVIINGVVVMKKRSLVLLDETAELKKIQNYFEVKQLFQ